MDVPTAIQLAIYKGETWVYSVTYENADGTPVDISGYTAKFTVKQSFNSTTILVAATTSNYIVVTGLTGNVVITLPSDITAALAALTEGVWDLFIYGPLGTPAIRLVGGNISINESVTP